MATIRIRKRGKTFTYYFEAGRKADGKRNTISKGGFSSKADAYDAGLKAFNDYKHGNIGITSEKMTLADYLESWLQQMNSAVAPSTIHVYACHIANIKAHIGAIELKALRPRDIDKLMKILFSEGKSYNTIKLCRATLHSALQAAVYPGELIPSNPASSIKVPKSAPKNLVQRTIISPSQIDAILAECPLGHSLHMPLFIGYHTGLRISEICGLLWDNIDFENHKLTVAQQIRHTKDGNFLGPLKNESSYRTIVMGETLEQKLLEWKSFQAEHQNLNSFLKKDLHIITTSLLEYESLPQVSFVCTNNVGKPIYAQLVGKALSKYGFNPHSLRHTHSTILAECGASPKEISSRLGHKKADITMDLYTHTTDQMMKKAADIFEKYASKNADKNADKM